MELQTSFRLLSEIIASYEAAWGAVRHVETRSDESGALLRGTFEVSLPYCSETDTSDGRGLRPDAVEFREDGSLALTFGTEELGTRTPATPAGVETAWEDVRLDDEAGIVVSVAFDIQPAEGTGPGREPVEDTGTGRESVESANNRFQAAGRKTGREPSCSDGGSPAPQADVDEELSSDDASDQDQEPANRFADVRDEAVPPFRDRPYLEALYDFCDTFVDMSERIAMEVSAETVRRYMIEAGVHEPDSYETLEDSSPQDGGHRSDVDTAGEESTPTPVLDGHLPADGYELPGDLTIEETIDAVVDSRSLYEVTRTLDLEHDQAREVLRKLDLLEFVSHRLVDAPEVETTYEEVATRIRRSSPQTV